jgi:hypothetical protein
MSKFTATFERTSRNLGFVELSSADGSWAGSFRVERRPGSTMPDSAYAVADREATLKGGRLERISHA